MRAWLRLIKFAWMSASTKQLPQKTRLEDLAGKSAAFAVLITVEDFYRRFYLRLPEIAAIAGEMALSPAMMQRRLRDTKEFSHSFVSAAARLLERAAAFLVYFR